MPRITITIDDRGPAIDVRIEADPPLPSEPANWTPAQAFGLLVRNFIDDEREQQEERRQQAAAETVNRVLSNARTASRQEDQS